MGITTLGVVEKLDIALWYPGTACAIIAHEQKAVTYIFEIVKRAFDNLPDELKPVVKYDNRNELQFVQDFTGRKLDSKIYVSLKLRSGTVTDLHISESAYVADRNELNSGSKQAVPMSGHITEESTGNGFNEFYDEVMDDIENWNKNNGVTQELKYKVHFYPWFKHPEYTLGDVMLSDKTPEEIAIQNEHSLTDGQLAWRRWKKQELGKKDNPTNLTQDQLFNQEYPSTLMEAFQSTGNFYFNQDRVQQIITPLPIRTTNYGLNIWVEPQEKHGYVVGCDPSNGRGIDYASVNVWDADTLEQVAQWHGYEDPIKLAEIIKETAQLYNNALAAAENNLLTTALTLERIYDNCYREVKIDKVTQQKTKMIGWSTNLKTRPVMMDEFRQLFEEGNLKINSSITRNEMRTFIIKDEGKVEHAEGKHDDSLFADFIALQIRKRLHNGLLSYYKQQYGQEQQTGPASTALIDLYREARRQGNF